MVVVRLVHWIVIAFVFIAIMTAIMGGKKIDLSVPFEALAPAGADAELDDEGPDQ
jgi:cytochrome b